MSKTQKILSVVVIVCVLFLGFVVGRIGGANTNATITAKGATPIPQGQIYDSAAWGKIYPLQYASEMKSQQVGDKPGRFGGNRAQDHFEMQPEILVNFKGNAFSLDYKDDRGHFYAIKDLKETKRVNEKTKTACITCKTPLIEAAFEEYGWDYASIPFADYIGNIKDDQFITCANCHDPLTNDLRVINPAFIEAQERRGIDLSRATREEMRSYVCAQCHSEYYFEPDTFKIIFPWDNGLNAEQVYDYYSTIPHGFQQDFIHADSEAKMLKIQHPEFETFSSGIHAKAGVSCADCHMAYNLEKGEKYSNHWVTSPLRSVESSCGKCHNQSTEWLIDSVTTIQEDFFQVQRAAGSAVAEAHGAIAKAMEVAGVNESSLENARELVRKAQFFWDYIAAENSMGFHSPSQMFKTAAMAIDYARQSIEAAKLAAGRNL
ncbi:MAG: ammonia-forming cytochrome c nitrite reductase subunit c552 [Clostridiales bacterium]|jgi:nitrite reductase (cytochrome c-552)|nr:ammonia-forming cytochrome c nitrite reductase subunit c552 [Clostridiales bacterium]MDR2711805.1 ammonia-forming cytochrome c nitrite reductase subunit c552 [Clostridiales bacterium]